MSDTIILNYSEAHDRYQRYKSFYEKKNIPNQFFTFDTSKTINENLRHLALVSLDSQITSAYLYSFNQIFLDIVSRWISDESIEIEFSQLHNQKFTIKETTVLSALVRIITLSPKITSLVEYYLDRVDIFDKLDQNTDSITDLELQTLLFAFTRLLYEDCQRFIRFISPHVLTKILKSTSDNVIKFLIIQLISKYLNLTEKAKNDMLNKHIDGSLETIYENDKDIDLQFLSVLEAQRFANYHQINSSFDRESKSTDILINVQSSSISPLVVSVCGILVSKIHLEAAKRTPNEFVPTERSINILRKLALNIQNFSPVMLVGNAGSGKTFLINELSKYLSCDRTIVKIHLGEQTDAKLLLGTYTSGQKPGTFEWRSGVLTTAVKEGRWVLIEDIDKAPTEVLSILLTLLEKRELTIPSRGEVIKAANGFQLISTIRTSTQLKKNHIPDLIGLRLWNILHLEDQSENELLQILSSKFPLLQNMIPMFVNLYEAIQTAYDSKSFLSLNKGSQPRIISVRDLMKFCTRVNSIFQNNGISSSNQLLESSVLDNIFAEAVDCFAGAINEYAALEPLINAIGEALQVPSSRINLFISKHVPLYEDFNNKLVIGRAHLKKAPSSLYKRKTTGNNTSFARTNHSLRLMEQIGVAVQMTEPVLLVGETGTGKTTVVQQVAKQLNKELTVINVSQQTEAGDLLGGYKPVNTKSVAVPIQESFENLFHLTFSMKKNEKFEKMLHKCFNRNQWKNVIRLWNEAVKSAEKFLNTADEENKDENPKKKRRLNTHDKNALCEKWTEFKETVKQFEVQSSSLENSFVFNFVEGSLVKAVKNGDWLLLDEINLASPDTLESISDLLSDTSGQRSILLSEKGEVESIRAHEDFRIFACMNPATDVGKRDLPLSIRSRFTEVYVHSPDNDIADLLSIIDKYLSRFALNDEWVGNDVAQLYLEAKKLAESNEIVDGANQKPHFSIRTLTRTLLYVCDIVSIYGLRRSLYEGFSMSFLTLLDIKSEGILKPLIEKYTIHRLKNSKSVISQIPPAPSAESGKFVQFRHYWMRQGPSDIIDQPHYIITPFVEKNMLNLVRATSGRKFPILVQGPTSSGKTSMIKYLANITGHKFVRINNHEHTDLQEYLGTYVSDDNGKLSFKEGVLVEALRKGHWLVLDELNLAPTDVLEALNRLLDDNRELFIPETQEVVHPHPDFMLFATQNPPGLYGGRKVLSRAFRNRFLELHFDDIPQDELEVILRDRCQIAPTYAKKIVEVYRQLSVQRQSSRLFEQKNSFATLRDLFRWALREAIGYEQLAANGYMLLAERVRKPEEKLVVQEVIEKVMRVNLDMNEYYSNLENKDLLNTPSSVVWTRAIRRLSVLISTAMSNNEPVLLVGETGCGKTTVCQLLAQFNNKRLITVNAHQNTETGDLLGAQRPIRNKSEQQTNLVVKIRRALKSVDVETDISTFEDLLAFYDGQELSEIPETLRNEIQSERNNLNVLFEWTDGPLVQALNSGNYFLLDEISLADDSVLERLNSVLEPERSLLLAEKGTDDSSITASEGFQFLATMNPGGDYGKKELSPALRNRFTEIWVPSMEDFADVLAIVENKLDCQVSHLANCIVNFSESFGMRLGGGNISSGVISLRDILAWVEFINSSFQKTTSVNASLLHGACMVFIDALGTNNTAYLSESEEKLAQMKVDCVNELSSLAGEDLSVYYNNRVEIRLSDEVLEAGGFTVARDSSYAQDDFFSFKAPTTAANTMRVVRAMQVKKPILLEGSPGVGKTSLVSALAKATGNALTRINLSEQTDLVDLFGSDAPAEGGKTGEFVWRDAPFLRAMQKGEWVLLDEMNLASQSVLEGLNACLDHRGEAYIPELDRSFARHPNFLVFAAQNPQYQGGGRKGLPKSFVNRFSVVYVDTLSADDLVLIANHLYPDISAEICSKMINTMSRLDYEICVKKLWGSNGGPWEFNLRDTLRWLELYNNHYISKDLSPSDFLNIIVTQRFRSAQDKDRARSLVQEIFNDNPLCDRYFSIAENYFQAGKALMSRGSLVQKTIHSKLAHLQSNSSLIESSVLAIQNNWPLIFVGPSNSGKTELVRYLSTIAGAKVVEFSMNSDIDSMDILGGYEQVDLTRRVTFIVDQLISVLKTGLASHLRSTNEIFDTTTAALKFLRFLTSTHITLENFGVFVHKFNNFKDFVQNNQEIDAIGIDISELSKQLEQTASVRFEWFDGLLVKAVERGDWLILDNANLCSPSVLDRLNSLLETNGSLIMNECSMADGQARVLKPHPNFRLFLTMDPKFGELSRAMRNRGVEIFLENLNHRSTKFDKRILEIDACSDGRDITLESLSLSDESPSKPVTKFIETTDSFGRTYSLYIDTVLAHKPVHSTIGHLTAVLPFITFSSAGTFNKLIKNSSEINTRVSEIYEGVLEFMEYTSKLGITQSLQNLGVMERCANDLTNSVTNFAVNQSLNPLWNSYANSILQQNGGVLPSDVNCFFQVLFEVFQGHKVLKQIEAKGVNGKISELNFIEQGAAIAAGRNLKNHPRLNVFSFLKDILDFVLALAIKQVNSSFSRNQPFFESLLNLTNVWNSLLEASTVKTDAKFKVFQEILKNWATECSNTAETKPLQDILDKFEDSFKLNRGEFMSSIWEDFRGLYPQSEHAWSDHDNLLALASEFDKVADEQYSDSDDLISSLKLAMLNIHKVLLTEEPSDVDGVFRTLESGVKNLQSASSNFLKKRAHNFRNNFYLLFNFVVSEGSLKENDIIMLAHRAGIPTSAIISNTNNEIYPSVFNTLWPKTDDGYVSQVSSLFTNKFLQNVFMNSESYQEFSGDQLGQTVQDAATFSKSLIISSSDVTRDMTKKHKNIILGWYERILRVVSGNEDISLGEYSGFGPDQLEDIFELVSTFSESTFAKVNDSFFLPALSFLSNPYGTEELGQAWVLFAIGLIHLYVPDSASDPAIEDHILFENYERKKNLLNLIADGIKNIKSIHFGDDAMLIEQFVPVNDEKTKPSKPRVYRSRIPIDNLFEEWKTFMTSTLDNDALIRFLEAIEDSELDILSKELDLFQQNSSNFIERLSNQFTRFSDVNDLLKGYIFGIKLGFDLILGARKRSEAKYRMDPLWFINRAQLTNTESVEQSLSEVKILCKDLDVDNVLSEQIMHFYLNLVGNSVDNFQSRNSLQQIFQTLYYRWSLRRTRQEQKDAAEGSIFKYQDQEDSDEDFKSIFPDFEEYLDLTGDNKKAADSSVLDEEYAKLTKTYINIFLNKKTSMLKEIMKSGGEITKKLNNHSDEFFTSQIDSSTLCAVVENLSQSIDVATVSTKGSEFDFYHGYSPAELRRSVQIVDKLQHSVHGLLQQWPEHDTLQTLFRISHEYLEFSVKTPIARLIQKVEQIYTFIAEWEKYASVKVSLSSHQNEFTNLIVSWRRLELSSWQSLFKNEELTSHRNIGNLWFNLYENVILPSYTGDEIDTSQLMLLLNVFMSRSTYGQYSLRLNLLRAIREHIILISSDDLLKNMFKNLIKFYEQFAPLIEDHLNQNKKKLEKDIQEVILLASWKDVNIDALKQSSRRSHQSLYKIVRKYRDLLNLEVSSLVEEGITTSHKVSIDKDQIVPPKFSSFIEEELIGSCKSVENWDTRPSHLKDTTLVQKNMAIYKGRVEAKEFPSLYDVASDIVTEMERLRSETPKQLTEDNKKGVAALKTQKRKLLSDTIREMRRIGLKTRIREDIHKLQTTANLILSTSESFHGTVLSTSDDYFFRIIDILPRLRASVASVAEDVPLADAEKGMAIIENLVYYIIKDKKQLSNLALGYQKLVHNQEVFQSIAISESKFVGKENIKINLEKFNYFSRWLPQLLNHSLDLFAICSKLANVSCDTSLFVEFGQELSKFRALIDSGLNFSTSVAETLGKFEASVQEFVKSLESWKSRNSNVAFIGESIIEWIKSSEVREISGTETSKDKQCVTSVEKVLRKLSTKILFAFQKIVEALNTEALTTDTDKWFTESQAQLSSLIKALHYGSIISSLDEAIKIVSENEFEDLESAQIKSLFGFTAPFFKNYLELVAIVLNAGKTNYIDVTRSTFIFGTSLHNLAKDGFCSPEPPSESKEDDNLQDGTGLGDGEGANNNSNDVEDDEDLTENAQEPNKDDKDEKDEDDENQDAVDIEGDMAGDLENASDQDQDDDEDDNDEDKEDLDEEVDDLDDLDPNAVDEKMWDEEAQEDKKEKESEKMPENSTADDMKANEDEDQAESKDNNDKPSEEQNDSNDDENDNQAEEEEEENVGEQEDEVRNEEKEELEQNVPETEALDLPDDINLDSGDEKDDEGEDEDEGGDAMDDGLDDNMDLDEDDKNADMEDEDEKIEEGEGDNNDEGDENEEQSEGEGELDNQQGVENEEKEDEEAGEDEDTLEAGDKSDNDENLKDNTPEDEEKDDAAEQGDRMEGIESGESGENNNDDIDLETAVEEKSGDRGEGAQAQADEEKEDIGASGSAMNQEQEEAKPDNNNDDARDDARESLKQLGDSLKEFHRRHQEIKESSEKDETAEQSANERPDEFEHVEGENTETNTQALGAADKDQITSIDEDKAIDDEEEDDQVKKEQNEDVDMKDSEKADADAEPVEEIPDVKPDEFNGQARGGFIGERKTETLDDKDDVKGEIFEEEESDEESSSALLKPEVIDEDDDFRDIEEARELWRKSDLETQELSASLCEQLRLILEPTLSTKLKGDYKTGKRLNMKRIIPYIASEFRKDKIWLRRTKPSKRQYQIMIAVDDSKSMSESKSVDLAFQSICLVSKALTQLESGGLSIVKFGENTKVVHPFDKQFTPETGAHIFQKFDFQQTRTDIKKLVGESIEIFNNSRGLGNSDLWQLQIIISDGVCEDHETVQRLVRRAREERIMLVFVIIDGINSNESIMDMSQVKYIPDVNGNMVLKVDKYLDSFPFEFYVVVRDITDLPKMLSLILRQYFSELASN